MFPSPSVPPAASTDSLFSNFDPANEPNLSTNAYANANYGSCPPPPRIKPSNLDDSLNLEPLFSPQVEITVEGFEDSNVIALSLPLLILSAPPPPGPTSTAPAASLSLFQRLRNNIKRLMALLPGKVAVNHMTGNFGGPFQGMFMGFLTSIEAHFRGATDPVVEQENNIESLLGPFCRLLESLFNLYFLIKRRLSFRPLNRDHYASEIERQLYCHTKVADVLMVIRQIIDPLRQFIKASPTFLPWFGVALAKTTAMVLGLTGAVLYIIVGGGYGTYYARAAHKARENWNQWLERCKKSPIASFNLRQTKIWELGQKIQNSAFKKKFIDKTLMSVIYFSIMGLGIIAAVKLFVALNVLTLGIPAAILLGVITVGCIKFSGNYLYIYIKQRSIQKQLKKNKETQDSLVTELAKLNKNNEQFNLSLEKLKAKQQSVSLDLQSPEVSARIARLKQAINALKSDIARVSNQLEEAKTQEGEIKFRELEWYPNKLAAEQIKGLFENDDDEEIQELLRSLDRERCVPWERNFDNTQQPPLTEEQESEVAIRDEYIKTLHISVPGPAADDENFNTFKARAERINSRENLFKLESEYKQRLKLASQLKKSDPELAEEQLQLQQRVRERKAITEGSKFKKKIKLLKTRFVETEPTLWAKFKALFTGEKLEPVTFEKAYNLFLEYYQQGMAGEEPMDKAYAHFALYFIGAGA